jgi:hypothetical protein
MSDLSPNGSPGTLTVLENYTQSSSGILRIGVGGLASGQSDLLAVGGHMHVQNRALADSNCQLSGNQAPINH